MDKLNRLDKLGVIPSASDWIKLSDLRDSAVHEYPDDPEINAANLNRMFAGIATLQHNFEQARQIAERHFAST